jgi:hypothetical protein
VSLTKQVIANSMIDVLLDEGGCLRVTCRIINERGWLRDCDKSWNFQSLAQCIRNSHIAEQVELNLKNKNKDQTKLLDGEWYQLIDVT